MKEIKRILFATDFSKNSEYAFEYAYFLAKKCDARLLITHVVHVPVDSATFDIPHASLESLKKALDDEAQKSMVKFCSDPLHEGDNYETSVVHGLPYDQIIKKARELSADLIVMGTRGRRAGLDRTLFGSTAEKVVRLSSLPVMTISLEE
ncbi:MAG: universal stress protein [Desulfuromonadales bacterium]|nr:universal stress protein [Desulfuromonadales bacterium]NOQ51457.1 universal stress protein [Desulfuromonadaceae bacterium]